MPKRKLVKPSKKTIAAIKDAHKRGIPITEEEALKIKSSAYHLPMPKDLPFGATISRYEKGKKGELRFWTPDHPKGPGKLEMPLSRALQVLERDGLTAEVKAKRKGRPVPKESAEAKRARSKIEAIEVALREAGLDDRYAPSRIAKKLGVTAARVRQVRKEMKTTEGT